MFRRNVGNHSPSDAASHRGRPQSPPTSEQHSARRLHPTDCPRVRISDKPQAKYNVRMAAISLTLYTNSTSTKLHIFARPKNEHHVQTLNRLPPLSLSPRRFADPPCSCYCLQEINKHSEIGCTETADVGMTFREIGHVMGAGYMPTEASKHARTPYTPSGR